jgi:Cu(I)/Ag(I) efflux system membrane protein CusA/SilA
MMETVILLKPESEWPKQGRWYSSWAPEWLQRVLRRFWPDYKSPDELIYGPGGLDEKMKFPGVSNAWTMPIKARVDMLSTGVRTPVGIKIMGADLQKVQELGEHIEMVLKEVPGTKTVFAERTAGGYFLDFTLKREELARYGLTIDQANDIVMSAIGGENVTLSGECSLYEGTPGRFGQAQESFSSRQPRDRRCSRGNGRNGWIDRRIIRNGEGCTHSSRAVS